MRGEGFPHPDNLQRLGREKKECMVDRGPGKKNPKAIQEEERLRGCKVKTVNFLKMNMMGHAHWKHGNS